MCVQYIGGYHEYIGDIMSTLGDVQYIWGYHDACGGYHEYIRGCSVHWGMLSTLGFSIEIDKVFTNLLPHMHHDIPLMH